MVGRATDLSRLSGYNDLLTELERLFNMEGLLKDPEKDGGWWRILYTDSEDDMTVVMIHGSKSVRIFKAQS